MKSGNSGKIMLDWSEPLGRVAAIMRDISYSFRRCLLIAVQFQEPSA